MSKAGGLQMVRKSKKSVLKAKKRSAKRRRGDAPPKKGAKRSLSDGETQQLRTLGRYLASLRAEDSLQLLKFFLDLSRCVAAIRGSQ